MTNNYLLIPLRNLRKNGIYSLLNVLGLGLSVACCILIFLMVQHHLSFDTFHKKADRIVRMVTDIHLETVTPFRGAPNPMSKALRTEFSFVEKTAMYAGRGEALISVPNASGIPDKYKEEDIFAFVEPELFEILDLPIVQGDVAALREPNTAMLTEKIARKYYGHTDVIDKTFRYDNEVDFRVVRVSSRLSPLTSAWAISPHEISCMFCAGRKNGKISMPMGDRSRKACLVSCTAVRTQPQAPASGRRAHQMDGGFSSR